MFGIGATGVNLHWNFQLTVCIGIWSFAIMLIVACISNESRLKMEMECVY